MLKDRVVNLANPEDVTQFLAEHPTSVIFKAGTCHKTMQGFGFLQERLEPREDLMVGIIRVIEWRAASNLVAELTKIRHESPQVILFKDGEAVFDLDNWNIVPEALEVGFAKIPPADGVVASETSSKSDLGPYLQVLEQYLTGLMNDRQFEYVYTTMFRDDASLRSREEVEVLNSIFGDVDQHINMHLMMAGQSDTAQIRQRAEAAYQQLRAL
ncbi:MAG: thioredoxin family protein [Trueperaceae bacterium]|nr:MAG: thioredoxin family protein [Trueperaceae bacterium]